MGWICSGDGCSPTWFDWVTGVLGLIGLIVAICQASKARTAAQQTKTALNKAEGRLRISQMSPLSRHLDQVLTDIDAALTTDSRDFLRSAAARALNLCAELAGLLPKQAASDAPALYKSLLSCSGQCRSLSR